MFIEHNQDNQELDFVTREQVMERDRERLQKMNFYCLTRECLRTYILNYFGEEASGTCGNCSNCLRDYETEDITEAAAAMAGCVQSCRERYGVNVILDTVRDQKLPESVSIIWKRILTMESFPVTRSRSFDRFLTISSFRDIFM